VTAHYDFIIAGGGCAGLCLAHALIHSPLAGRSILIVDRDDKDQNDRTWAYWSTEPSPFERIIQQRWTTLSFAAAGQPAGTLATGDWHYAMIRGDDFYRHVRSELAARPEVTWIKATVKRIDDGADAATVWLDVDGPGKAAWQAYHGTWVFDSLFNIHRFEPDLARYRYLQQCFKGWFIETPEDAFDPGGATIFDFRTPQAGEMRFFYVLPTSPRAALVEYVGLSEVDYDALLEEYVHGVLGIREYSIVSDETGTTPLTDYPFPRRTGHHVMTTGIQGGLVKPTSGYAYTRILDDSAAIVRSLLTHGHPFDVPATKPIYRWLDSVMLEVMRVEPERLADAFTAMFARNPAPRIFRFLDERASVADIVGLVLTLPKLPFLRGAGRLAWQALGPQKTPRPQSLFE
jgi:lycopene beta-cyclase